MKKITKLLVVFTLLLTGIVYGQQDPHYTQYMYNQNILNPAVAGSRADLSIALLGRTQWVGIDGAPDTQTINVSGKLGNNFGAAISLIHDQIGPLNESNIALDLSYAIPVSSTGKLALGVKGTYNMLNYLGLGPDDLIDNIDPALNNPLDHNYPNVGAGLYYYTEKFYLGFAVPNILKEDRISLANLAIPEMSKEIHYFGTLGYVFTISDNLKFKPSTMVKFTKGSPISFDLNGSFFINDMFELGLSWREGDSIDALLGVQVAPTVRIGYAYDHTLTNLGNYNSGSHEIMLLFDLDFAKKHIKSPRFF